MKAKYVLGKVEREMEGRKKYSRNYLSCRRQFWLDNLLWNIAFLVKAEEKVDGTLLLERKEGQERGICAINNYRTKITLKSVHYYIAAYKILGPNSSHVDKKHNSNKIFIFNYIMF